MQKKGKDIKQEANYLKSLKLTMDLLNIFLGERKGTKEEKKQLQNIIEDMQDGIYTEAVYLLTHTCPKNHGEAKKIIVDVIKHRNNMVDLLHRNVSIQVATLDYLENIRNILLEPEIIKLDTYNELEKVTIADTGTIAYDKRLFHIDLEKEVERTKRLNAYLSLMFIDVEESRLKGNGDKHSGAPGVLKQVSGCIHAGLRKYDSVYGYGGYTFVVLLPLTNVKEVEGVARRIMKSIRSMGKEKDTCVPDINIGISSFKGDDLQNGKDVLVAADAALLKAKKSGRNRIFLNKDSAIYECVLSSPDNTMNASVTLKGRSIVPGYAMGTAFHYHDIESRHIEVRDIKKEEIPHELNRITGALEKVKADYRELRSQVEKANNPYDTEIFDVYISLLEDVTLIHELEKKLKEEMLNAEQVVKSAFHQLIRKFRSADSLLIREKALDIEDIGKRLLKKLTGIEENILSRIPPDSVIFTKRLLPSDIVHLRQKNSIAIITEQGGDVSHSAIIARNLGIPSVTDIVINYKDIPQGAEVLINGYDGLVIVHPTRAMKDKVRKEIEKNKLESMRILKHTKNKELILGDERIYIDASIHLHTTGQAEPYDEYIALADDIGLFRIESFYMQYPEFPPEILLFKEMHRVIKHYKGKQITVQLTDFGGDKIPQPIQPTGELKSPLGFRGIRFLFEYPEILIDQLRVCLQLSAYFNIRILVPMVSVVDDMVIVRDLLETQKELFTKKGITYNPDIQLGAMIELPSAFFTLQEIAAQSDFLNIGTNDLIQYTMGAGRQLLGVSSYYERGNFVVIPLVKNIVEQAKKAEIPVDMSGELAGNLRFTDDLLLGGIRRFSVAPLLIPQLKNHIQTIIHTEK